ncbi:MAG: DMT family transporter [Planctomycetota bacterium]
MTADAAPLTATGRPVPRTAAPAAPGSTGSGLCALALVQVMFGLFPVFGRLAMDPASGFTPFAVATWRISFGAIVLGLVAVAVYGERARIARRDVLPLLGLALLGIVLNQGFFLAGLERSTPINAGLMICLIPVFAYSIAVALGRETLRARRAAGVVVALAGSVPLFVSKGAELSSSHAVGNALMAANAFCYAIYIVLSKPILTRMPPLVLVAWVYVLSLPFLPLFAMGETLVPEQASRGAWMSLAYVLVFPTVVAYALNSFALARVEASTTAFFIFAQPVITAIAAWALLGETLTPALGIAAVGLFVGMALVVSRERR